MVTVKQGDIVFVNITPIEGHEQDGRRPALVVSGDAFNAQSNVIWLCPITSTDRNYPLHVRLDGRTKTSGVILCDQIRALDLNTRSAVVLERLPKKLMTEVSDRVYAIIDR